MGTKRLSDEPLQPIALAYLICLNVKHYRDARGVHYFDPLWHKDVIQHVRYLENITLACPCHVGVPPPDAIPWTAPLPEIRFIDLPDPDTVWKAVLRLPATSVRLWKAIGRTGIVHTGIAGWPIPLGWAASALAFLRGKPCVIIVESAPWRLRPGLRVTLKQRLKAAVY